ncbi:bifunctional tRNA (mnm(5)s(2)U34)-methyltransferase/FAD-dependent cmnm(5)s(2)U34 oxidoreductase [Posidoniimonas polymericola]|uniref:Bifunctional tRNA (Mnm(5)s(2)U34)-methyltransferase/FAD-dependent cmnm(5)s(2)U34 oxidoreductase n=1 Tax=Posidoniimonas polymericola TaxID=2528002 RepID=A0A5C5YTB6_9BACT|nr:FAD-dependent oxidoreductase [Posidoniimonas polymericola]TWT78242.1 bifunctional tRNA (mnm(5)s(2)U34)-methyltransferase/FAD-dependent cmnm(5)s(2)U34 oxidoreductase [Posidoniimonas polymericola]
MALVDTFIAGQGIAGTTLAWAVLLRGGRPVLVDGGTQPTASRVAAGLLAPVGGKRFGLAWRAAEAWPAALAFYRRVEQRLGIPLVEVEPITRLFVDEQQRGEFERRVEGPLCEWVVARDAGELGGCFKAPLGGCRVLGARLDVAAYLDHSRAYFAAGGMLIEQYLEANVLTDGALDQVLAGVASDRGRRVVLCRGFAERDSGGLPFEPGKGELLTVRAAGALVQSIGQQVVQRSVWMAPLGEARFRVGATFDRDDDSATPTKSGLLELREKLDAMLGVPYEVVEHQAGVRPIVRTRRPLAGTLPGQELVGVLNGLGANGTLWAPWVAGQYAEHLLDGKPLDAEIEANRRLDRR